MSSTNPSVVSLPATISFHDAELSVLDQQGEIWLQSSDIAKALGYSMPNAVTKIFNRNSDEFSDDMTALPNMGNGSAEQDARIFSLRGAHLIAMFSRTKRAKEFRKWVLDVLDNQLKPAPVKNNSIAALITDRWHGPALAEIPSIMNACAQRLSGAMCLPHFQSAPAPSEFKDYIAHTQSLRNEQIVDIAVEALKRIKNSTGSCGVQQVLREVNADFLLVNESELIFSFYHAKRLGEALNDE